LREQEHTRNKKQQHHACKAALSEHRNLLRALARHQSESVDRVTRTHNHILHPIHLERYGTIRDRCMQPGVPQRFSRRRIERHEVRTRVPRKDQITGSAQQARPDAGTSVPSTSFPFIKILALVLCAIAALPETKIEAKTISEQHATAAILFFIRCSPSN
jgi:hypothetical protein